MIAVEVELLEVCSDHVEHSWYLLLIVVVRKCQQSNYGLEHIEELLRFSRRFM